MAKRNVIIELRHTQSLESAANDAMFSPDATADRRSLPDLVSLEYDTSFAPVMLPRITEDDFPENELYDSTSSLRLDLDAQASTYLVRGTVEDEDLDALAEEARTNDRVVNISSDVLIETQIVCPGSAPVGNDSDVERLLCTASMHRNRMNGSGVLVAIVDSGVNMAYLNNHGKNPNFDAARSWAYNPAAVTPGSAAVGHGTMCAYDVCIAAPNCTILDVALLRPLSAAPGNTLMGTLLSDAIRAYRHLLAILTAPGRPGESRSLVVNNSWGMFHPSWDFPVGHPGNYSDNPSHPFNVIVASLERAGADILFAAGNCGVDCPDGRCGGVTTRAIYGANSSPAVTSVAGVDTTKARVGYSAIGPGRLTSRKPDISGYTHFSGSGVYPADGGTSAACPVVAGVYAAIRSRRPFNPSDSSTRPAAIRNLVTSTAEDLGATGYDFAYGHGVVNGCALVRRIIGPPLIDICDRFPWICRPFNICDRYPWLCRQLPIIPPIRIPDPIRVPPRLGDNYQDVIISIMAEAEERSVDPEEMAYILGYLQGMNQSPKADTPKDQDYGCC